MFQCHSLHSLLNKINKKVIISTLLLQPVYHVIILKKTQNFTIFNENLKSSDNPWQYWACPPFPSRKTLVMPSNYQNCFQELLRFE